MAQKNEMSPYLYRYTELHYLLQILTEKKIYLINPHGWDDKNDVTVIEKYKEYQAIKSIYALCLTKAPQTYHHWKVFTGGKSGVCISFHRSLFEEWCKSNNITYGDVKYYKKSQAEAMAKSKEIKIRADDIPYSKNSAYADEKEFRAILKCDDEQFSAHAVDFDLSMIHAIGINPWLELTTVHAVQDVISNIDGCDKLLLRMSTIRKNESWCTDIIEASIFGELFSE